MLERLLLKNFQKHKLLRLALDPHVTTIVGPNDAGKTAIMRALYWLAMNRPTGSFQTALTTYGQDSTTVKLGFDEGHTISRHRGDENTYNLDGSPFRAVGSDVPEPVRLALNISDLNFQSQHDPIFWISDTGGQVSRNLNAIIDLGIIDTTLANLATAGREVSGRVSVIEERLAEAKKELTGFAYLADLDLELQILERKEKRAADWATQAASLGAVVAGATTTQTTARNAAAAAQGGQAVVALGTRARAAADRYEGLRRLASAIDLMKESTEKETPQEAFRGFSKTLAASRAADQKYSGLKELLDTIQDKQDAVDGTTRLATVAAEDLEKETGGLCPVCHKPILKKS